MINPYWELVLLLCLINIIFAVSLNLILGYNGQFSLGHAGFLAVGAYASGSLTASFGWPLWAGILMAIFLSVVAAVVVGYPCLRLRGDYLAIATLGFAEIIRIVALALPKDYFGGPTGMQNVKSFDKYIPALPALNGVGNFIFTLIFSILGVALLVWGAWALANLGQRFCERRRTGPAWRWVILAVVVVLNILLAHSLDTSFREAASSIQSSPSLWLLIGCALGAAWLAYRVVVDHQGKFIRWSALLVILNAVVIWWHRAYPGFLDIFQFGSSFHGKGFESGQWVLFALFVLIVAVVTWLVRNYLNSLPGRAVIAIREDEIAATNLGVNCTWMKLQNFMFGSALAGLSGAMLAHTLPLFKPTDFNFFKSVDVLLMVVLGGMGSITGSFVGATIITVILEALRFLGQWRLVFYSLILILFMIFRPGGLLGTAEIGELIKRKALSGLKRLTGESADEPEAGGRDA